MAQQHIILGTPPAGSDGDTARSAFTKTEDNFTDLYSRADGVDAKLAAYVGRNRIINGNFDIWQRGTSFSAVTAAAYSADRWLTNNSNSSTVATRQAFTPGQTDVPGNPMYYLRSVVTSSAGTNNYATLRQRIENVMTFAGQTCTLSFWAKADSSRNVSIELVQRDSGPDVLGIGVTKLAITSSWKRYSVTISVPAFTSAIAAVNYLELLIWFDAGSTFNSRTDSLGQQSGTFDIAQVQLVAGDADTDFEVLPPAQVLFLCQRYYEKSYDQSVNPGSVSGIGRLLWASNGLIASTTYIGVQFKVTKRSTPSITVYSSATGAANRVTQDDSSDITPTVAQIGQHGFQISWTNGASRLGGWFHYVADAEL